MDANAHIFLNNHSEEMVVHMMLKKKKRLHQGYVDTSYSLTLSRSEYEALSLASKKRIRQSARYPRVA